MTPTTAKWNAEAEKAKQELADKSIIKFPKNGRATKQEKEIKDAVMNIFLLGTEVRIQEMIKEMFDEKFGVVVDLIDELEQKANSYRPIKVITETGEHELNGLMHNQFERLLQLMTLTYPVMLVGPAGSGKTFAAEQAADALGLDFYAISVGAQTSKSDLLGYMHAGGEYVRTAFRDAYENGGVFLMDEVDAGNPNVLIVLNSALAGGFCSFPDGMIRRHKDFKFVATANTYGRGASREYVGRNQIDAATLDRFITLDWQIDETLERAMIEKFTHGNRWLKVVAGLRKVVEDHSYRIILSPRATLKGASMLELGIAFEDVVRLCVTSTATPTEADVLIENSRKLW